jgi:hypothetical protein
MKRIPNWRQQEIEIATSRCGKLAVVDIADGLLRGDAKFWPAPELLQKLTRSGHQSDFDGPDLAAACSKYGHYSDLQSLRSEDAVTWSVFGTLIYADPAIRAAYARELLLALDVPVSDREFDVWLWRRVPHPDTGGHNGPEIDFAIQSEHLLLLGEAKWGSKIGAGQGVNKDENQLSLRRRFFELRSGDLFANQSSLVLLTVSSDGGLQVPMDKLLGSGTLYLRDAAWSAVSSLASHPLAEELGKYLAWKRQFV